MFKRCHGNGYYIIKLDSIVFDKDLEYEEEPIPIIDHNVCKLLTKEIKFVKVQRKHYLVEEATWELEKDMRTSIPNCSLNRVLLRSFIRYFS